ncbi:MAG TPA: hypothetical protein VGM37_02650 [Armatimonadota bacterium]|jgi:hypothetical protein
MLSDEEKTRITERVQYERDVREALTPPPKQSGPGLWSLLNSSLGLLLVTSLITSFLVPRYQARQQRLDWQRQVTAENLKYRLGMMRECLMEFSLSNALTAEAYERVRPLIAADRIDGPLYDSFRAQLLTLQNQRFQRAAKVMALIVYFPHRAEIADSVVRHNTQASLYVRSVEAYAELKRAPSADAAGRNRELTALRADLGDMSDVSQTYTAATELLLNDIHEEETRYEKFEF